MSNGAIALIVIGVFVVLVGLYLGTTARRDRASATGLLSRETVRRQLLCGRRGLPRHRAPLRPPL